MLRFIPVASEEKTLAHCLHCGQECTKPHVRMADKVFCCAGCSEVYQLIQQCELGNYYQMREGNASKAELPSQKEFEYLRDPEIRRRFIDFENNNHYRVSLHIPNVHCTACVYLLERLQRFLPQILEANVDFLRKEIQLKVAKPGPDLPEIARLLGQIGYPPDWQTKTHSASTAAGKRQQITRKMAVAGFSFGNIMLLSLPEYLSEHGIDEALLSASTQSMSVLLSLPVVLYSASDYFTTAFEALKKRVIKLDIPIALGIAVLFLRSVYEIVSGAGTGYLDSLSALVFFLLLGRLFQEKSFHHLHFDRDQQSFFPLAVLKIESGGEQTAADYGYNRVLTTDTSQEKDGKQAVFSADEQRTETEVGIHLLKAGDQIRVRHLEVVPADSLLTDSSGLIDYSFVTGESEPVACFKGDVIYAGGRIAGTSLRMEVLKPAADAYLMKLWNQNALENSNFEPEAFKGTADKIARYFTPAVIIIALLGFGAWLPYSIETAFQVLSAVLIIACPCALALSAPLSLGHGLRLLARSNFFVRNTSAIDRMARIRCLVFDKTGTLSQQDLGPMSEENIEWSPAQQSMVQSVCRHSTHPLSKMLAKTLPFNPNHRIQLYDEQEGKGINALVDGHRIQIGRRIEAHNEDGRAIEQKNARAYSAPGNLVWVRIDGKELGYVHFKPIWRSGIEGSLHRLGIDYEIHLLSGDNPRDGERIAAWFPPGSALNFRQSPLEKKHYIGELSRKRAGGVAMIGDGLNDAGALQAADVGIAVSEKSGQFSPACDVILAGDALTRLPDILAFVRSIPSVLYINLAFSVTYNLAGLSFALSGTLTPLLSAIFMPISSLTVLLSSAFLTRHLAHKYHLT